MEAYNYVDLFASKGMEYLLVIGMLVVFVPFWLALKRPAQAALEAVRKIIPAIQEWFRLPQGYFFHQGHGWAQPEEGGIVKVGMDDFASKLVGKILKMEVPAVGATVTQGAPGWALVVDGNTIPMLSPVAGEVVDVNEDVIGSPDRLGADPYGDAWLMKVKVPSLASNMTNLLSGTLARRWMDQTQESLMARSRGDALGLVLQDGGMPIDGMARAIDPEKWDAIVKEYFLIS